ncbi:DUF596 domain-containing protein [Proteus vulgaris]|nr:DUF596 domain-containing protein [Proteus vulgaris]
MPILTLNHRQIAGVIKRAGEIDQFWFFDESCPGGAVWILQDGTQEWT